MGQTDNPAERWAAYLSAALARRHWQQRDLIAASGGQLRSGTLSKWINGRGPANAVWAVRVARWLEADEAEALRAAGRDELLARDEDGAAPDRPHPGRDAGSGRSANEPANDDEEFIAKLRASSDPEMHKLADRFEQDLLRVRRMAQLELDELERQRQAHRSGEDNADNRTNRTA